ncbi:MAG: protein-methionine-sulfoxide reductase heme-binding subunit MsrQ [Pseudomonadota bacterium]
MKNSLRRNKWLLMLLLAVPALALTYAAATNQLGPDPADALVSETGEWTIRLLCLTLFVSPLASLLRGRSSFKPLPYRRILGVATWVYGILHLVCYAAFLLAFQWGDIGAELIERPYITVGFAAVLLMTPLAITSTDGMVRKLKRRWKTLHKLVYAVALLAVAHIVWQIRSDAGEAIVYSLIIASLLIWRLLESRRAKS